MDTIIALRGMKFYAYHGVSLQETKVGNTFLVDVFYSLPLQHVFDTDEIEDTVSYAVVYDLIKQEMAVASKLLETVAARMIRVLKEHFPELSSLKIELVKLNPPVGGEVHSASVTLEEKW